MSFSALKKTDVVRNAVSQSKTRQTVIVLTASAYNSEGASDPGPYATQIRQSGVKILTIAFIRENERDEEVRKISDLASPGFSFTVSAVHSAPSDLILQAFCRANCFCPNGWFQVSDDFQKPFIKYAECVRLSTNSSNWNMGKTACASEVNDNAFLASERSEAKHKFHADYIRSIVGKVQPYFIGLSWHTESRQYLWSEEYDDGTPIPLDPNGYQAWASGNGHHRKTPAGVLVVPLGLTGTYWYDVDTYRTLGACMCQVNACDSHNYCDDSVDHDN
ncbi:CRE-CLEC-62 protein [Aphelenchoides avenae]|nr:CRE-CLEC-62 protein [Aphelenchus avenae]